MMGPCLVQGLQDRAHGQAPPASMTQRLLPLWVHRVSSQILIRLINVLSLARS